MTDFEALGRFRAQGFEPDQLLADPLDLFREWFATAHTERCAQPEAMALATADADGVPGVRNVLLRGLDHRGLVFYTNERSQKGRAIFANPNVEALFSWLELDRQVRVAGRAAAIAPEESDAYFAGRPRLSQLGSAVSRQSEPLTSRRDLERRVADLDRRHEGREIPRPLHWGGFRVVPKTWEFWQGREGRLHDRFRYYQDPPGTWKVERLHP